ncbi:MAG: NAD+ synthase, partial [Balneolaceae bacterium]
MKIRVEQINPTIGDLEGNKKLILSALERSEQDETDLLILQEMVTIGYPPLDLLESESFRKSCYQLNDEIVTKSQETAILFGSITKNLSEFGRKMHNSALLASNGNLIGMTHKTLLPTYDVFDDLRYFEPNKEFNCLIYKGLKLGVTICEDLWYNENEVQYHTYKVEPAKILKDSGADLIVNISASPYTKTKHENRELMLRNHVKNLNVPLIYCNQVGAHTDIIFDGDTMAVDSDANVIARTEPFQASYIDIKWDKERKNIESGRKPEELQVEYPKSFSEKHFYAIKCGLKDYLYKTGITGDVILGLSGGIDSAVVCSLAVEAVGAEHVKAITMPSTFSSKGSVSDSETLAKNLGIELFTIPIHDIYQNFNKELKPVFGDKPFSIAEENLQSRIRGTLLMAYANKFGVFLLPTGNKSEYAVGYATLYGDMNGALAIIGDLYKTEVYELANWMNQDYYGREMIPKSIIEKPPSAELRPGQRDSDSLPEYEVLDELLYRYIELQQNAEKIILDGFDSETVHQVIKLVDQSEFKRYQAAPILKLSSKSFGIGRRWP